METKKITINYKGLKLKISVDFQKASDESIVFIHGSGCSKKFFKDIWDLQKFKKFSILAYDWVGFGDSSKPVKFSYSMDNQAEICRLLIEKLNLDKINLVCHSMGGIIGLLLTEKIPNKIVSFINLEGNLTEEDAGITKQFVSMSYKEFKKSSFNKIKKIIKESKDNPPLFYKEFCRCSPFGFYYSSKSSVECSKNEKLLALFLNLRVKKAYFYGDKGIIKGSLNLIKNKVKTVLIPKSGHFMMIDNPDEFYSKLYSIICE